MNKYPIHIACTQSKMKHSQVPQIKRFPVPNPQENINPIHKHG